MKSNFEFLNKYWPVLAQLGANAENYLYSDPNACIYKLGMFAERLVREILVFEHIDEPQTENTHANRIRSLKKAGLLPQEIDNTLYLLRKTRNSAVHTGTDSVDDAKMLFSMTYNLAVWFMETYGDWKYIADDFTMPKEVHQADLKSVIEDQEKKIVELSKKLAEVTTAVSGTTQQERVKRSQAVSSMMEWNEAQTRCLIDEQLRKAGFTQIVMMTGDSDRTARAIAARVGVDKYYSEVLPEDKAKFVEEAKAQGRKVLMVGDGINDSPALSAADVGIAISDGAELAREIADITIGADDLSVMVTLKEISNGLMDKIHKNYRRIVGINGSLIALGVTGVIQPTMSALLHNTSTLLIGMDSMKSVL